MSESVKRQKPVPRKRAPRARSAGEAINATSRTLHGLARARAGGAGTAAPTAFSYGPEPEIAPPPSEFPEETPPEAPPLPPEQPPNAIPEIAPLPSELPPPPGPEIA